MTLAADFSAIERTLWKNDADTLFDPPAPVGPANAFTAFRFESSGAVWVTAGSW